MEILKQSKVKRCKDSMKCDQNNTKIISKHNRMCTVNDLISACSFIFLFFVKNHLLVISDVIICKGYTIFANTQICKLSTYSEIFTKYCVIIIILHTKTFNVLYSRAFIDCVGV